MKNIDATEQAYKNGYKQSYEDGLRDRKRKNGAIISGYQGIGKSTLAKSGSGYIDLESGNFFVGGIRPDDWYIPYCQIAIHLAQQGYRVFVSSHAVVREYLASLPKTVDLYVCFPSYNLHLPWVKKLEARYHSSGLEKDYRAWKNAEERFHENIRELHNTKGFVPIVIRDINYWLPALLDSTIANFGAKMDGQDTTSSGISQRTVQALERMGQKVHGGEDG